MFSDTLTAPVGYVRAPIPPDAPTGAYGAWLHESTGELVITGNPPDDEDWSDSSHNCDMMGCRQDHVLERREAAR